MDNLSVILGLVLSILGVLSYVVKLAVDYSRLKSEVKELKNDLQQEKKELENKIDTQSESISEIKSKIQELADFKYTTGQVLSELSTTLKMMSQNIDIQFKNLEDKIDSIGKAND